MYNVPTEFQQLLGMSRIVLSPGSIRKNSQQCAFRQSFVFEIKSNHTFPKHSEVFTLHDTSCDSKFLENNWALHDPNCVPVTHLARLRHISNPWTAPRNQMQHNNGSALSETQKC